MKYEKIYKGFLMSKVWQILKHFAGTFHQAQTLKLRGVLHYLINCPVDTVIQYNKSKRTYFLAICIRDICFQKKEERKMQSHF